MNWNTPDASAVALPSWTQSGLSRFSFRSMRYVIQGIPSKRIRYEPSPRSVMARFCDGNSSLRTTTTTVPRVVTPRLSEIVYAYFATVIADNSSYVDMTAKLGELTCGFCVRTTNGSVSGINLTREQRPGLPAPGRP